MQPLPAASKTDEIHFTISAWCFVHPSHPSPSASTVLQASLTSLRGRPLHQGSSRSYNSGYFERASVVSTETHARARGADTHTLRTAKQEQSNENHTHTHTHTHTRWEPRKQEQSKKSGWRQLLRKCRAALDVLRSVEVGWSAAMKRIMQCTPSNHTHTHTHTPHYASLACRGPAHADSAVTPLPPESSTGPSHRLHTVRTPACPPRLTKRALFCCNWTLLDRNGSPCCARVSRVGDEFVMPVLKDFGCISKALLLDRDMWLLDP